MKSVFVTQIVGFMLIMMLLQSVNAQWSRINTIGYSSIQSIAVRGDEIFIGTRNSGVSHSFDNGISWTEIDSGLTDLSVFSIAVCKGSVFAATYDGVFHLSNDGTNWTPTNTGLIDSGGHSPNVVSLFVYQDNIILAGTSFGSGIFRSIDNGSTWTEIKSGIPNSAGLRPSFAASGDKIFALFSNYEIFLSTNSGLSWNQVSSMQIIDSLYYIAISGDALLAVNRRSEIFRSTDNGSNWTKIITEIPTGSFIQSFTANDSVALAGTYPNGIYKSIDHGILWTPFSTGLTDSIVTALAISGNSMLAGTRFCHLLRSSVNGPGWTEVNSGFYGDFYYGGFAIDSNDIFISVGAAGLLHSVNNGISWTSANLGVPKLRDNITDEYPVAHSILLKNEYVFAAIGNSDTSFGLFRSANREASWSIVNSGLTDRAVSQLESIGNIIFAKTSHGNVFSSINNGESWTQINTDISMDTIISLNKSDSTIFVCTKNGEIFRFSYTDMKWENIVPGLTNAVFNKTLISMIISGSTIIAGTLNTGSFLSTDNGLNWTQVDSSLSLCNFVVSDKNIFAAGFWSGFYFSTNNGKNWIRSDSNSMFMEQIIDIAVIKNRLYALSCGEINGLNSPNLWQRSIPEMIGSANRMNARPMPQLKNNRSPFIVQSNSKIIVKLSLNNSTKMEIEIFNLSGRKVATLVNTSLSPGPHDFSLDTRNISAGCYWVRVLEGKNISLMKAQILH